MGLLDQIIGNLTGGGQAAPAQRGSTTSPLVKALMLLLAAKAYRHYTSGNRNAAPQGGGGGPFGGGVSAPQGGGGLGGMLGGGLGGLLGGLVGSGGLGNILGGGGGAGGGGLGQLVDQFRNRGYGDEVDSWIGTGPNQPIDPSHLGDALGPDTVDELAQHTGMPQDQILGELSQELPDAMDHFTPDGRLPTEDEASSRWV